MTENPNTKVWEYKDKPKEYLEIDWEKAEFRGII